MHIVAQPPTITPPTAHSLNTSSKIDHRSLQSMFASMRIQSAPPLASLTLCQIQHITQHRRPVFLFASAGASNIDSQQQQDAAQTLKNLVENTNSAPTEAQLQSAVDVLLTNGTGVENPGSATMTSGSGTWKTVHAPHINRMSSILGTKFSISYTLTEANSSITTDSSTPPPPQFYSNVRYESPFFGSGWLSASGRLFSNENDSVKLHFDTFWVDEGGEMSDLRPFLTKETMNSGDKLITAIGRVSFIEGLAKFPVLYLDPDTGVSVFRFPPLRSNITVVRQ
jgi:hypothetical protein